MSVGFATGSFEYEIDVHSHAILIRVVHIRDPRDRGACVTCYTLH